MTSTSKGLDPLPGTGSCIRNNRRSRGTVRVPKRQNNRPCCSSLREEVWAQIKGRFQLDTAPARQELLHARSNVVHKPISRQCPPRPSTKISPVGAHRSSRCCRCAGPGSPCTPSSTRISADCLRRRRIDRGLVGTASRGFEPRPSPQNRAGEKPGERGRHTRLQPNSGGSETARGARRATGRRGSASWRLHIPTAARVPTAALLLEDVGTRPSRVGIWLDEAPICTQYRALSQAYASRLNTIPSLWTQPLCDWPPLPLRPTSPGKINQEPVTKCGHGGLTQGRGWHML